MHPQIESLFDDAENRYLKPEELKLLTDYVESLPIRMETYRKLRDEELQIMQQVADLLQAEFPQEPTKNLERSIKHALLMMRYCAMAMLLNDQNFVKDRLLNWLPQTVQTYNTQAIDQALFRLLDQKLSQAFSPQQMSLLSAQLKYVQSALLNPETVTAAK